MRRPLFFLLFVFPFLAGILLNQQSRYRDVFRTICEMTKAHFYRDDDRLKEWVSSCRIKAAKIPLWIKTDDLLREIQDQMSEMNISHFQIYSPTEERRLWKGEELDTGIRARFIDDYLIVYRVLPGTSAAKAGVKVGDEILTIEGVEEVTPWGAQHREGQFTILRDDKDFRFMLHPEVVTEDLNPSLADAGPGTALLTIPSFRSEFFGKDKWQALTGELSRYRHVIVDLRENAGGNFVAMLRGLSPFFCSSQKIGTLMQPRLKKPDKDGFDDETEDQYQIDELASHRSLGLLTFADYGCYTGKTTVLIGPSTSSVAEIFAHGLGERSHSRVWGQPSAGDVVLAVWYDLPALGNGYSFSIPEAVYLTPENEELEGKGVKPQKELYYNLEISRQGRDSWVVDSIR